DPRLRVKALDHPIGEQRVGQGDQGHALVMRHVGRHDHSRRGAGGVGRLAGRVGFRAAPRVVDRVEEAVVPFGPGSIIAASTVAYGATTTSSPSPRFRPRPGTPNALY